MNSRLRDIDFYRIHLEEIQKAQWAISACAGVLETVSNLSTTSIPGVPKWWNQGLEGGLLNAIEVAASRASERLDYINERIRRIDAKSQPVEEVTHEISIPLSDDELSCMIAFAAQDGMTADELITKIVKTRLKDWPLA